MSRHRMRVSSWLIAAVSALISGVALVISPASVSAATPQITFDVNLYGSCIDGSSPAGSNVSVVWRSADGTLKDQGAATDFYGNGSWEYCSADSSLALIPGDKIKATEGSYSRTWVVPTLTLHLDRVNNLFEGTGPAGRTLRLCISTGDFGRCHSVRVAPDGTWSYDSNDRIIHYRVGFGADVSWTSPNGDVVYIDGMNAPYLVVTIGKSKFSGETDARGSMSVSVNGGAGTGSATGDRYGDFSGQLRDSQGHAFAVSVGDHVQAPSLASDADWIVPEIDGTADAATDVVSGKCFDTGTSAQAVEIIVWRTGRQVGWVDIGTDSDGTFSINMRTDVDDFMNNPANIKHGDKIVLGCTQNTGDVIQMQFLVP
jgi:hypothetical protein